MVRKKIGHKLSYSPLPKIQHKTSKFGWKLQISVSKLWFANPVILIKMADLRFKRMQMARSSTWRQSTTNFQDTVRLQIFIYTQIPVCQDTGFPFPNIVPDVYLKYMKKLKKILSFNMDRTRIHYVKDSNIPYSTSWYSI